MANTYTLIASSTVGSGGAATITFSSIASTYTDLKVVVSGRNSTSSTSDLILKFNGSSSGYTQKYIIGTGVSAVSGSQTYGQIGIMAGNSTANTFATNETYIPNYASSNYKSFSSDDAYENNATQAYASFWANLWSNTAAITSIELSSGTGNFVQYSTAYLYGIKNS
jgi:hypothetical protein